MQSTESATESQSWTCFHCGEICTTKQQAIDHFGYDELELPACIAVLTETEKAIVEDRREWRERARQAEAHNDQLHHRLHTQNFDMIHIGGAKNSTEAVGNFLTVQGQLLATQAILGHMIREYMALDIADDIDRAAEFRHIWKKYDPQLVEPEEYLKTMGFKS